MNLEVYVSEISRTYRNLSGKGGGGKGGLREGGSGAWHEVAQITFGLNAKSPDSNYGLKTFFF